jgi:hypothetical protein
MQRLFTIDTEGDLVVVCRLVNIFRRKGAKLANLVVSSTPEGFHIAALVEVAENEFEHFFNFIRRTEGVGHVAAEETASVLEGLSQVT